MILKGKYNSAKVCTGNIDNATISQIIDLCNQECFSNSNIVIMPDCHAGKGCTIGTTMTIDDKVVPNLVGVDIGCGVSGIKLNDRLDLNRLDNIIRKYIPHGFSIHNNSREALLKQVFNLDLNSIKCSANIDRAFLSLGTLGGGNHFIEVDESSTGEAYLIVHSGSRNLGKNIAEYYQKKAIEYCNDKYTNINKGKKEQLILELKNEGRQHEIPSKIKALNCLFKVPQDSLCFLEGELMNDYLHDMDIAQKYAIANRIVILTDILYNYYEDKTKFNSCCKESKDNVIECIHNYIDIKKKILRKGAISAQENELVLIPINMRDGIIVGKGKGNVEWNCSAPHGAGRILSRSKAKESISLEDYKESMKDVFTTCVGQSTLDEAPQAYKPIEDILGYVDETIDVIETLRPIYNFKSN